MNGFRNGCRLYHFNVLYNVESDRARYFYSFIDIHVLQQKEDVYI